MSRPNPDRWLSPELPGNGEYHHDDEYVWIDTLEQELPETVPVIHDVDEFVLTTSELARIRAEIQVASQQCNAAYLNNLEILLGNIGQLKRVRGVTWCGFGVLGADALELTLATPPVPQPLFRGREETLAALLHWLLAGEALQQSARARWIAATLGEPTRDKRWLVGHLANIIQDSIDRPWLPGAPDEPPRSGIASRLDPGWSGLDDGAALKRLGQSIPADSPARQVVTLLERLDDQPCHFRFDRWTDNFVAATGALDPEARAPKPQENALRAWTQALTEWVLAINAWIDSLPLEEALAEIAAPQDVTERVYTLLGAREPAKVWLTASLSKTMRSLGDYYRPRKAPPPSLFTNR